MRPVRGRGSVTDFDRSALYDDSKSINEGALTIPGWSMDGWQGRILRGCGLFDCDVPIRDLGERELRALLYQDATKIKVEGINLTFLGIIPQIQKSFLSKDVEAMQPHIRAFVERAVTFTTCPDCDGTRLKRDRPQLRIAGRNIAELCQMQVSDLAEWGARAGRAVGGAAAGRAARHPRRVHRHRPGYLSLDRPAGTLSGGEAQRTKLIRHLGSSLTDVTYVFDEPTIGLHPHDIGKMNTLLLQLRDKGNTVLVVEHKPGTIAIADHVCRHRPAGGHRGRRGRLRGVAGGPAGQRHPDRAAPRRPGPAQGRRPHPDGGVEVRWGEHAQPAGRGRRRPARRAGRRHRGGRVGQELAGARVDQRPRGRGQHRPERHQGVAAEQPGDLHRPAGAGAQGVRQGQRGQAGPVQRELRGRLPVLQRGRRDHHRDPDHGHRLTPCEECEGKRFQAAVLEYRLGGKNIAEVPALPVAEALEYFGAGEAATPAAQKILSGWWTSGWATSLGPAAEHPVRRRASGSG